jgi:hypothetical protein
MKLKTFFPILLVALAQAAAFLFLGINMNWTDFLGRFFGYRVLLYWMPGLFFGLCVLALYPYLRRHGNILITSWLWLLLGLGVAYIPTFLLIFSPMGG